MDISVCKDTDVIINHSMNENILSLIDINLASEFKDLGVNIFDINDPFFNDLCTPFNYHDIDIILEDRYNFIYKNFTFCEEGCINTNIDFENKFITCQCRVKPDMNNQITQVNLQPKDELEIKNSNIDVMKCTKLIFNFSNKSKNIGFIIFFILILIFLLLVITHAVKGITSVSNFVFEEMKKYNYVKEDNPKFFEEKKTTNVKKVANNLTTRRTSDFNNNSNSNKNKKVKRRNLLLKVKKKKNLNSSSRRQLQLNNSLLPDPLISNSKLSNPPGKGILGKKKKSISVYSRQDEGKKEEVDNFGIIKIELDKPRNDYYPKDSSKTLHNMTFKDLNKAENRNIFQIMYIFLLSKQILFHTFLEKSPLVPFQINFCLFIFTVCFDLALNGLFYTNSNISKKYNSSKGLVSFTLSNNTLIIIISTLVSFIAIPIMIKFSKTDNEIRKIFRKEEIKLRKNKNYNVALPEREKIFKEVEDVLKCYKIKLIILLIFQFLIIMFFFYFITAFCQVYPNTQANWLMNSLFSLLIRFVFEMLVCLLFAKFYQISASIEYVCFYKIMLFIYDFS